MMTQPAGVSFLRDVIGSHMIELGKKDERVALVNADLSGTCRNRSFVAAYPNRSFNVGIAEQNMVSFAAGLAHEGFIPFAFSMAPFVTMRACEQCRTDVAYANLPVRLMGTYAGISGGISGATHWSMEDVAIMSSMPNMAVLEPCDAVQARRMLEATLAMDGPVYIRSTVEPCRNIYDEGYQYRPGKADLVQEGSDGAFICSGVTVQFAIDAAKGLEQRTGAKVAVWDMHSIKPLDINAIESAARTGSVVVAQDHNIVGGLGQLVATAMLEGGMSPRFRALGVPDCFESMAHPAFLYQKFGYDAKGLERTMLELLG